MNAENEILDLLNIFKKEDFLIIRKAINELIKYHCEQDNKRYRQTLKKVNKISHFLELNQ